MFRKAEASLSTLPVEILHHIFNELDETTLFIALRDVCQQLRAAIDTHHQYALDFTAFSKPAFCRLLHVIRPEHVTSLCLSSDATVTPGQIGVFLSMVHLQHFTRLRSLTLLNIEEQDLCSFLEHAKGCSLTSLTLNATLHNSLEQEKIAQLLLTILGQPSLLRLELLSEELSELMEKLARPAQCRLRYLRMTACRGTQVSKMIAGSPDLETLTLDERTVPLPFCWHRPNEWFSTLCPRLTSLTLTNFTLQLDELHPALAQTPSLRHLKIITSSLEMMDGTRWEDLIKTKLPFLNNFEFYTRSFRRRIVEETAESVLNRMISPFSTSLWTDEKRWLVTCNWLFNGTIIEIYTPPICISLYTYVPDLDTQTISNFERENQYSTMLEEVEALRVNLFEILSDYRNVQKRYPQSPRNVLSPLIDLSKVKQLALMSGYPARSGCISYEHVIHLLKQIPNIHSVMVEPSGGIQPGGLPVEGIYSAIIPQLDRSKLRHLNISAVDIHQVQVLLETFRNLFSIRFSFRTKSIDSEEIIAYVKALMPGCSNRHDRFALSIWVDRRVKTINVSERPTLCHGCEIG